MIQKKKKKEKYLPPSSPKANQDNGEKNSFFFLVALWCKKQSLLCPCFRRMQEGLAMPSIMSQHKEPKHCQILVVIWRAQY